MCLYIHLHLRGLFSLNNHIIAAELTAMQYKYTKAWDMIILDTDRRENLINMSLKKISGNSDVTSLKYNT